MLNNAISDLIDEINNLALLSKEEIEENIGEREISKLLTHCSNKAIVRFVNDLSEPIVNLFQENFININLGQILEVTFETYGSFNSMMHPSTQKKCWNEVLKITIHEYIRSLLTTGSKKVKDKSVLLERIGQDRESILKSYNSLLGENTTKQCLKIVEDFLNFLECSSYAIGNSCSKIREYNGPSFNLAMAKVLINLRTDLSKTEKNEAISACKDVLSGFTNTPAEAGNGFEFQNIEQDINENEEATIEDEAEVVVKKKDERRKTLNLLDFLNIEEKEPEEEEAVAKGEFNLEDFASVRVRPKSFHTKVDSDIIIQGDLQKKGTYTWQTRFFQLKNGSLYWYMTNKAAEAQNSMAVKDMSDIELNEGGKFKIVSGDKIYKFYNDSEEKAKEWYEALKAELKKHKSEKKIENIIDVKLRKKVIVDFYKLPRMQTERANLKKSVEEQMRGENYFPPRKVM
jgi:hypothetical protein